MLHTQRTPVTESSQRISHYDAATAPRGILRHMPSVLGYPRLLWEHRWLIHNFFRRDLLGRFRGTILGMFWVLAQPLFQFCIYFLVFGFIFKARFDSTGTGPDPYFAMYLFSGILMFSATNEATNKCCQVVTSNGNLVKKVRFPTEVLPLPAVMVSGIVYLIGAMVCLLVGTLLGVLQPGIMLLFFPLVVLVWMVLLLGVGMFLGALQVFARDTSQIYSLLSMAWLFTSPVFWVPSRFAEVNPTLTAIWFKLNPMHSLLMASRTSLGWHKTDFGPFWEHLGIASVWALFWFLLGYGLFVSRRRKFADLV